MKATARTIAVSADKPKRRIDETIIVGAVFYLLLAVTGGVMLTEVFKSGTFNPVAPVEQFIPEPHIDVAALPSFDQAPAEVVTSSLPAPMTFAPRYNTPEEITIGDESLTAPMTASLGSDGIMHLQGTMDSNAFIRVISTMIANDGKFKSVSLNSPGGSVEVSLMLAMFIREKGLDTIVADGALCASACPLVFAAGVERTVGANAKIGVHQVYSDTPILQEATDTLVAGQYGMSAAQTLTGVITRHLSAMGVDPSVWFPALETPPDQIYIYSMNELLEKKLATAMVAS